MKILLVLTSHDQLGNTGHKTGFWLEEFASPYYVFKDAGAQITLASPKGGQPPIDPKSDAPDAQTAATRRFAEDAEAQQLLATSLPLAQVRAEDFDALFYPVAWPALGPGRGRHFHRPDRALHRPRQAGGRGLPRAGRAAPCQGRGRHAAGAWQARHRLQQQ